MPPVMRSRLRAHAVEWHVAPAAHVDPRHRADFLELQRRCNSEICRHGALTRNAWLDSVETAGIPFDGLLHTLRQLAIFLRQLALAREQHTLRLSDEPPLLESEAGVAVVICFDENGVPWCPSLPGVGLGDPYIMSERLHAWWSAWQKTAHNLPKGWGLQHCDPETRALCELIDRHYNSRDLSTALGTMLALENGMSTDFWQRLSKGLRQRCEENRVVFPDAGFFPVAETHARLQARHGLYLVEGACIADQLQADHFFGASQGALDQLNGFWKIQSDALITRH